MKTKRFFPVIHPAQGVSVALTSVGVARDAGADGVFLINQGMSKVDVLALAASVRSHFPDLWLGLNLLGVDPSVSIRDPYIHTFNGLWCDNAGCDDVKTDAWEDEEWAVFRARAASGWQGEYFGGVAFKYQNPVATADLGEICDRARTFVDVVTTSGTATGHPADPAKARAMRNALGEHRLALASGISPLNVTKYLPYVTDFLVATGIEKSFGVLSPDLATRLSETIHG